MGEVMTLLEELVAGRGPRVLELTVGDVDRMIDAGILQEGAPFELIEGLLVRKDRDASGGDGMAHGVRHALVVSSLARLGPRLEALGCCLRTQLPVVLSGTSAPEPDVAVLRGALRDFAGRHPGPADLVAVIEVADRSLAHDRGTRQRLYAAAGVRQYWIVNLVDDQLEVYEEPIPSAGRYARRSDLGRAATATLALGAGASLEVPVASILGP
jgi:hypothetical protein